ncbi:MAG: peptidylprolyl isomerase [Methylohalobius crimeensis]
MKKTFTLTVLSCAILAGCNAGGNKASEGLSLAPVDEKEAVAIVNGQPISRKALEYVKNEITRNNPRAGADLPEDKLVEELVDRELLKQEALQKQLPRQPEVAERIRYTQRAVLSQANVEDYLNNHPITEEQLQAEYDRLVGAMKKSEYQARHVLVKTEDAAKKIIERLKAGEDFAKLAEENSIGPSAKKGGDLGWFVPERMVEPFSEAVIALENGKYTEEPVQTQFGWHVILREDSREKTPPPFEQVKPQIEMMLKRQMIQEHVDELKQKAEIKLLTAKAAEKAPAQEAPKEAPREEPSEVPATPAPEQAEEAPDSGA